MVIKKDTRKKTTKNSPAKTVKKRNFIRFPSDVGAQAFILTDSNGVTLKTPLPALVVEESFKGCSIVALKSADFHEGAQFKVKVGRLDPLLAEIRWIKTYDLKISYIGLVYLD